MRPIKPCNARAGLAVSLLAACAAVPGGAAPQGNLDAPVRAIVEGNRKFALSLYSELRGQTGNLFLSPFSISTALSMACSGARGQTADQMAAILRLPSDCAQSVSGFSALVRELQSVAHAGAYQLNIANGLWSEKDFPFLPDFMSSLRSGYGAEIEELDFIHKTEAARATINSWVERRTEGRIKDLFPQGTLNSTTRLVLANAIYFKGKWAASFKSAETGDAPFTASGNRKITVRMMRQTGRFGYLEGGDFQVLEMPYQSEKLAMDVFLPRKVDGLDEFERELAPEKLSAWLTKLHRESVQVALPKFKTTSSFGLNSILAAMGMSLAFSRHADFTGMSVRGKELFLSAVVHKAYADVNEEGTEAAAATGVGVATKSVMRTIEFRADHPFFFLIRDVASGAMLFMGRVENPS
jgi:serpin B